MASASDDADKYRFHPPAKRHSTAPSLLAGHVRAPGAPASTPAGGWRAQGRRGAVQHAGRAAQGGQPPGARGSWTRQPFWSSSRCFAARRRNLDSEAGLKPPRLGEGGGGSVCVKRQTRSRCVKAVDGCQHDSNLHQRISGIAAPPRDRLPGWRTAQRCKGMAICLVNARCLSGGR